MKQREGCGQINPPGNDSMVESKRSKDKARSMLKEKTKGLPEVTQDIRNTNGGK